MRTSPHASALSTVAGAIGDCPTVRVVIYQGELTDKSLKSKIESTRENLKVYSVEELRELGKANPCEPVPPKPEDIACIMYT